MTTFGTTLQVFLFAGVMVAGLNRLVLMDGALPKLISIPLLLIALLLYYQWCLYFAPRLTRIQRVTFNETNVLSTYNERHGNMEIEDEPTPHPDGQKPTATTATGSTTFEEKRNKHYTGDFTQAMLAATPTLTLDQGEAGEEAHDETHEAEQQQQEKKEDH